MRDLRALNKQEVADFFNSFDIVLSDVDGVLWNVLEDIPGTDDAVKSLQKLGKRVIVVSNNTSKTVEMYLRQFKKAKIDLKADDVVTPIPVIVSYLKKQNLATKKLFVIGMTPLKDALRANGFEIAENGPDRIGETLDEFVQTTVFDDESVSAVVVDFDFNLNYVNIQKATSFLRRSDVLFVKGATDRKGPAGLNYVLTGPGFFQQIVEEVAGREALSMAKPSPFLHEYIVEKYGVKDVSRVLFVGDSVPTDMGFAAENGYEKLLVLSGLTKREDIHEWQFPEELKPDYYADSLKSVHDLVLRLSAGN